MSRATAMQIVRYKNVPVPVPYETGRVDGSEGIEQLCSFNMDTVHWCDMS